MMILSQNFLNWKQAQNKVNHCSKKERYGEKGKAKFFFLYRCAFKSVASNGSKIEQNVNR